MKDGEIPINKIIRDGSRELKDVYSATEQLITRSLNEYVLTSFSNQAAFVPIFHKLEGEDFLSHDCTEACPGFTERTSTGWLCMVFLLRLLFSFLISIIHNFIFTRFENRARFFS